MNVTGASAPSRRSSCSISGRWRWPSAAVGDDVLGQVGEREPLARPAAPAPEAPDLASTVTEAISAALGERRQCEQRGGRVAAGVGDQLGVRGSAHGRAR